MNKSRCRVNVMNHFLKLQEAYTERKVETVLHTFATLFIFALSFVSSHVLLYFRFRIYLFSPAKKSESEDHADSPDPVSLVFFCDDVVLYLCSLMSDHAQN